AAPRRPRSGAGVMRVHKKRGTFYARASGTRPSLRRRRGSAAWSGLLLGAEDGAAGGGVLHRQLVAAHAVVAVERVGHRRRRRQEADLAHALGAERPLGLRLLDE